MGQRKSRTPLPDNTRIKEPTSLDEFPLFHLCIISAMKGLIVDTHIHVGSIERVDAFFNANKAVNVLINKDFGTITVTVTDYVTFNVPDIIQ